jgi:glycosyltransferase involved in cell wall biosynthesis
MIHDLTLIYYVNARKENPLKDFYKNRLKPKAFKLLMSANCRLATKLTIPTEFVREQLIDYFKVDPSKVVVTPEAVDQYADKPEPIKNLVGKQFLLFIGNPYPYKNLQRLIDAFALLNRPGLHLVLAGKPNFFTGELERYVSVHGIKNVFFPGYVTNAEQAWLYQNAEIYTFPSLSEGFSLTGLEAMYSDLPVASSNASCLPEVCGDAAAYFDPYNPADMAKVIGELLDDPKLRQELIKKGRQRVKQFSWRRMSEQTLAIYKDILGQ